MRLYHVSLWFGQVREPIEYAWYYIGDLRRIDDGVDGEFRCIYNHDALTLGVF